MLKKVRIGDLGEVLTGNTPSKRNNEFYESEDIMFVKPDILSFDIIDIKQSNEYLSEKAREKARIIPKGSLLVSCIGNIGKLGINTEEVAFNQQINAIVHNSKISSSKYLAYLLKYNQKKLESIANAPVVPIINKSQFSDFELLIHEELEVQRKIVEILDKAQELIDRRKEQIEALDELVKSQFIEMFGYPLTNIKGFPKIKIKDVIDTSILKSKKVYGDNDEISYIDISCIDNSINKIISHNKYLFREAPSRAQQCIQKGDILISTVRPNLKNIAMVEQVLENMVTTSGVTVLRSNKVNKEFLYKYVLTDYFTDEMVSVTSGANYPAIKPSDIYNHEMIYPPIELQNQFADFVEQVDKLKFEMEKSLKELEDNFNSLMQKAFKGELFN